MAFLSIIIPAHQEAGRLPGTLQTIDTYLAKQSYSAEVIVVENGSHDRTADVVREFAREHPYVRLIQEQRRGKGLAVRLGMLAACGQYRFMCDADLSMPIDEIDRFLSQQPDSWDVAIGTRNDPASNRYGEPLATRLRGCTFNVLVKLFVLPGFEDTQCGFKCFTAEATKDLFTTQVSNDMSFDVEVLFIARKRGYKITKVPIDWYFNTDSKVRMFRDPLWMIVNILTVRLNWWRGKYASKIQA
jgi:glycosyltransferase involved in cell wall biosynthesis